MFGVILGYHQRTGALGWFQQNFVVIVSVKINVVTQALGNFCRASSFSNESSDVGSKHGKSVIQSKKGVKSYFFKFPLSDN